MSDYAFDNRTLACHGPARSLTYSAKYVLSRYAGYPTVCYSLTHSVRVLTSHVRNPLSLLESIR